MHVIRPQIIENLSRTLARASAEQLRVSPRGGNTTTEKFLPPFDVDLNIDLTQMNHVLEYEPANLTISVEAGMTLAALQHALREHGQFLPLDPPQAERATIGGIIASNVSGPLRLRYGTVRDWLIGVRVVLADGSVVRGGGKVVKNVAGYDLPKLFVGSMGTLGVIAEATFKLAPWPPDRRTVLAQFETHTAAVNVLLPILRSVLLPSALEILSPPVRAEALRWAPLERYALLARFAGTAAAVNRQAREFEALCRPHTAIGPIVYDGLDEEQLWNRLRDLPITLTGDEGLLIEMRLLPSQLDEALTQVQSVAGEKAVDCAVFCRAAQSLWIAIRQVNTAALEMASQLREWISAHKGWLLIQRAPAALSAQLDRWGPPRNDFVIMQRLKGQFDPQNILNPGIFVGGI